MSWREELHPRNLIGRFRVKGMDEAQADAMIVKEPSEALLRAQAFMKAKAVDGDGDGLVYDGTPRERPATPAEVARGRKLRSRNMGTGKKPGKHQKGDKFVIRGRDADGNLLVHSTDNPDEAQKVAEQWAKKKHRNVRVVRIRDKGKQPGMAPSNVREVTRDDGTKRPDPKPDTDLTEAGLKDDRAKAIYNAVDWDSFDVPDEHRAAGAHYLAAMDAAVADNKDRFDSLITDFFDGTNGMDPDDADALSEALDDIVDEMLADDLIEIMNEALDDWGVADINEMFNNWKVSGDPYFDADMAERAKSTPAFKHLQDGGGIGDAPEEGLYESIKTMRDRFNLTLNANSGVNQNWWVEDKETGEMWMLKGGARAGMEGIGPQNDAFNEVMATAVFSETGLDVPTVRLATSPDADAVWTVTRHAGEEFGGGRDSIRESKAVMDTDAYFQAVEDGKFDRKTVSRIMDGAGAVEDPGDFMSILMADFLLGGSDRHAENFMWIEGDNGLRFQLVDNGGTFAAYEDPDLSFEQWFNDAGNILPKLNAQIALFALGGNEDGIADAIERFKAQLGNIDIKQIKERLKNTPMTPEQRKLARKHLAAFEKRLRDLQDNSDMIVKELMEL